MKYKDNFFLSNIALNGKNDFYWSIDPQKGKIMVNQIVCPNCKRIISHNPVIEDAAKGAGSDTQSLTCECGERITYWQIDDQLRKQKTTGKRLLKWIRSPFVHRK